MHADLPYNAAVVSAAIARIDADPIALTETDLLYLKTFLGDAVEERARSAHQAAILARVPAGPIRTKAVEVPPAATKAASDVEAIADAILLLVQSAIAPMTTAVAALDQRIAALETTARVQAGDERVQ